MKHLTLLILLCSSLLGAETNVVTLAWDPPKPEDAVEGYRLYATTNLAGVRSDGLTDSSLRTSLTNAMRLAWAPTNSSIWRVVAEVPAGQLQVTITNVWPVKRVPQFFTMTATNRIGESPFSDAVWWMTRPSGDSKLRVAEAK